MQLYFLLQINLLPFYYILKKFTTLHTLQFTIDNRQQKNTSLKNIDNDNNNNCLLGKISYINTYKCVYLYRCYIYIYIYIDICGYPFCNYYNEKYYKIIKITPNLRCKTNMRLLMAMALMMMTTTIGGEILGCD